MYGYIRGKRGWQRWCWWARIVFDMSRAAQEQGRGRGKTQLRETDIKTDAGRLHERTYVHIPEYMSVHLQKRFSGSLIASTIIIIIICDKRREGVFPLARSDIVPLSFARPIPSFRIHRCCIYNKSSRKATIRGGKLQMQFVTHKFKKHKNETLCVCVWVWGGGGGTKGVSERVSHVDFRLFAN